MAVPSTLGKIIYAPPERPTAGILLSGRPSDPLEAALRRLAEWRWPLVAMRLKKLWPQREPSQEVLAAKGGVSRAP